jgi:hypothetical protein
MMGDRLSLSVVTATPPARRKQKDQLRAGHTIPLNHSGAKLLSYVLVAIRNPQWRPRHGVWLGGARWMAAVSTLRFRDLSR